MPSEGRVLALLEGQKASQKESFDEFRIEWKENDDRPFQEQTTADVEETLNFYENIDITDPDSLPLSREEKLKTRHRILWLLDNAIPERKRLKRVNQKPPSPQPLPSSTKDPSNEPLDPQNQPEKTAA